MNLTQLTAIHIALDCIGYSPQVVGLPLVITPDIRVLAAEPVLVTT
jgi:hypothetical protein